MVKTKAIKKLDRFLRALHLYTGMFLVPWILVYAASAFFINHGPWLTNALKVEKPQWTHIRQVDFKPGDDFPKLAEKQDTEIKKDRQDEQFIDGAVPTLAEMQAQAILRELDLEGFHRITPTPNKNLMVIIRASGGGNFRITWRKHQSVIDVERLGPFSVYRLINFLHFQGGYSKPFAVNIIWAVIVDAVALSMALWVISGIYIWARRPSRRIAGGISLAAGCLLFLYLVVLLCK